MMNDFTAWQQILDEWKKVQRMKWLNQRLYDQLGGSIIHVIRYAEENGISLPNRDRLYELVDKAGDIIDEINLLASDESLQPSETDGDLTTP